ncbi:MAG: hypothetical protein NUW01_07615 [Gemmatimonadaceae bacterium]|nr:hypothetical protein [Gemmatimonadaceae bacterium]
MYSTCLFCHRDLGRNEFVEHFQVGRRLAFDSAKGRLWVVCRRCERWNLTPLEERWEAIEECERAFSDTKLRVSTDNIGLARMREGVELVRIGAPKRPEMAAWRYGDQFGRRRRRHFVSYGIPSIAVAAFIAGDMALGGIFSGTGMSVYVGQGVHRAVKARKSKTRLKAGDDAVPVGWDEMQEARMVTTPGSSEWSIVIPQRVALLEKGSAFLRTLQHDSTERVVTAAGVRAARVAGWPERAVEFQGADATNALRKILPFVNPGGGSGSHVRDALSQLEEVPEIHSYFALAARRAKHYTPIDWADQKGDARINKLPPAILLALEMAAHEEIERRAMEGELARLEDEWRDAEEIAAIADNMFVPNEIQTWIDRRRGTVDLPESQPLVDNKE